MIFKEAIAISCDDIESFNPMSIAKMCSMLAGNEEASQTNESNDAPFCVNPDNVNPAEVALAITLGKHIENTNDIKFTIFERRLIL